MRCNGTLAPVTKAEVIDRLEPLTREYYDEFSRCTHCGRIYWAGSHHAKLLALVERLLRRL
jgi:uncharacterized protein with PIN domain